MAMIFLKFLQYLQELYHKSCKGGTCTWDRKITDSEADVNAIVINSGIANACTKDEGMEYCRQSAKKAASELGAEENSITFWHPQVLSVCSSL